MEYNNFIVECMINDLNVTEGHRYEVYQENEKYYWIKKNRYGASSFYPKEWFKKVEEKKGLNIIEAMKMPIGTEFEVVFNDEKIENNTMIIYKSLTVDEECKHMDWKCHPQDTFMKPYDFLINAKFIPIQKSVSFMEAVASEKNMIRVDIEDIISGLSENMKEQLSEYNTIGATLYCLSNYFTNESLVKIFQEGKWYIEQD